MKLCRLELSLSLAAEGEAPSPLTVAVASDVHERPRELLSHLKQERFDALLLPGDILEEESVASVLRAKDAHSAGLAFLREAASLFPVFYAPGNHESFGGMTKGGVPLPPEEVAAALQDATGATVLSDAATPFGDYLIGALSSGFPRHKRSFKGYFRTPPPNLAFLDEFSARSGRKLLLSHHPEYYLPYLRERDTGLILSGHAHGGQLRLLGRGLFAPGQGFLPRYTKGLYEGRLFVSPGLSGLAHLPRLGNPPSYAILHLT